MDSKPRFQKLFEPGRIGKMEVKNRIVMAAAITSGRLQIEHITGKGYNDPEIISLAHKVNWQADPTCDRTYGTGESKARIDVKLKGGRTVSCKDKGYRFGHPKNPISKEYLIGKFRDCASYSAKPLSKSSVEELIRTVDRLEELEDVSRIVELVS